MLRETLLADGLASRTVKETIATEVSRANQCLYCVGVHQALLETLPPDRTLSPIIEWARTAGRHNPENPTPSTTPPPFPETQAPELCGVVVTFHYINRMATLFLADSPMPARTPTALHRPIMHTTAHAMRPTTPGPLTPGESLDLLPPAPLPHGLEWALSNPPVAQALARAHAAVNQGAHWIPRTARKQLHTHLNQWNGSHPGPSRAWLNKALTKLPPEEIPTTQLALLTALAPHQTLPDDITAFKNQHPTDRELIELTSYAALTTAIHIGSHIHPPHRADTKPTP
ncbi:alkylhydroperoxidase [Streptomyces sp. NPDC048142]|uniref:alkylhydroperoxidase n=1 Tax=Streptomyces sp. NPDC048142 TaxID=3365501 RepID=UPI003715F0D2